MVHMGSVLLLLGLLGLYIGSIENKLACGITSIGKGAMFCSQMFQKNNKRQSQTRWSIILHPLSCFASIIYGKEIREQFKGFFWRRYYDSIQIIHGERLLTLVAMIFKSPTKRHFISNIPDLLSISSCTIVDLL